jgi:hypothetical protein
MKGKAKNPVAPPSGEVSAMSRLRVVAVALLLLIAPLAARAAEPFRYPEARHGKGELRYVHGIPVLTVEGTPEEVGEQIGVLALKPGAPLLGVVKDFMKQIGLGAAWPVLALAAHNMETQFPPDYRKELNAAARASGVDRDTLILANVFYDLTRLVGCSTLIVGAERSATKAPLFGRNLDFAPIDNVQHYGLVVVYRPRGKHAFASITYPGIFGCMSGMNDAGLCVAALQVDSTADGSPKLDPKGMPLLFEFRRVMEECRTVVEAERLLRSLRRTTTINLAVCDPKGGAVFEITPKSLVVRRPEDGFCPCTNHFRSKELATSTKCWRYDALEKSRALPTLDLAAVARAMHAASADITTIQTMIFEPASLRLHLAMGDGPTSARPLQPLDLAPLLGKIGGK